MIGSRSKVRSIFRTLAREGVTEEALARVHAPIGLDLRAETPDEIALSIAAELLQWWRGGTGRPLKDMAGIATQVREAEEDAGATSATGAQASRARTQNPQEP
jgi:xanthine dehydrogenase accessory factor